MTRDERQSLAIDRWKEKGGNGIILAATGVGKTRIAMLIMQRLVKLKSTAKVIVVVPTTYLKGQWLLNASKFDLLNNIEVLVINTACKHKRKCDLLIVDECHTSVSETFFNLYKVISYNLFLGLTATLNRLDGLESKLLNITSIVDEITLEDAIENQWISPYKQYKVLLNVDLTPYEEYNSAFLHHFASFDFKFDLAMGCLNNALLRSKLARMTGRSAKEIMIHAVNFSRAMRARKDFIYDHLHKIEVANTIIKARTESKIITFTKNTNHAELVCCGDVYHGKLKKKDRDKILNKFIKQKTGVINTCKVFDVGVDIEGVNSIIVISGDSSSITKAQRVGRSIRFAPGRVGEIWNLVIKGTVEEKWFEKANDGRDYEVIEDYQLDDFFNGIEVKEADTDEFTFVL